MGDQGGDVERCIVRTGSPELLFHVDIAASSQESAVQSGKQPVRLLCLSKLVIRWPNPNWQTSVVTSGCLSELRPAITALVVQRPDINSVAA